MTKTERILQALAEMGFYETENTCRAYRRFNRPAWLIEVLATDNYVYVGQSAAFRTGKTVAGSRSLDAATTITRWQSLFLKANHGKTVTLWKS